MASLRLAIGSAKAGPRFARKPSVLRGTRDQLFLASGRANVATAALYGVVASGMATVVYVHAGYPTWRIVAPLVMFTMMLAAQVLTVRRLERNPVGVGRAVAGLHGFAQ